MKGQPVRLTTNNIESQKKEEKKITFIRPGKLKNHDDLNPRTLEYVQAEAINNATATEVVCATSNSEWIS